MRLSDIQNKDIINVLDGKKIGNIIDVRLDSSNGNVQGIILETKGFMNKFVSNGNETEIVWSQIKKIGEDVILVETN